MQTSAVKLLTLALMWVPHDNNRLPQTLLRSNHIPYVTCTSQWHPVSPTRGHAGTPQKRWHSQRNVTWNTIWLSIHVTCLKKMMIPLAFTCQETFPWSLRCVPVVCSTRMLAADLLSNVCCQLVHRWSVLRLVWLIWNFGNLEACSTL